jgi:hypothetical protein
MSWISVSYSGGGPEGGALLCSGDMVENAERWGNEANPLLREMSLAVVDRADVEIAALVDEGAVRSEDRRAAFLQSRRADIVFTTEANLARVLLFLEV